MCVFFTCKKWGQWSEKTIVGITAVCKNKYMYLLTLVKFDLGGVSEVPVIDRFLHACVGDKLTGDVGYYAGPTQTEPGRLTLH